MGLVAAVAGLLETFSQALLGLREASRSSSDASVALRSGASSHRCRSSRLLASPGSSGLSPSSGSLRSRLGAGCKIRAFGDLPSKLRQVLCQTSAMEHPSLREVGRASFFVEQCPLASRTLGLVLMASTGSRAKSGALHFSKRVELAIGAQTSIIQLTLQNLADAIVAGDKQYTDLSGAKAFSFSLELSSCCA